MESVDNCSLTLRKDNFNRFVILNFQSLTNFPSLTWYDIKAAGNSEFKPLLCPYLLIIVDYCAHVAMLSLIKKNCGPKCVKKI